MTPATSLAEAVTLYINTSGRIGSEKTAAHYRNLPLKLGKYLNRPPTLDDLTDEVVGGWITRRKREAAPNTVRGEAAKLLAVWRWLAKKGHAVAPDLQVPRRAYSEPRALTRQELRKLWRGAATYQDQVGEVPGNLYFLAIIWVCWDTAERIGAVMQLRWSDINLDGRTIYFPASIRKGGVQDARKPIGKPAMRALRKLQAASPETPFGGIKRSAIYYHWAKLQTWCGLPKDALPHALRRSHATYLHLAGGDATKSLGHSNPEITNRHYIDGSMSKVNPLKLLPKPGGGWLDWIRRR